MSPRKEKATPAKAAAPTKRQPDGRAMANMYLLLDLLYDKAAGNFRAGASDAMIAEVCGINPNTVSHARLRSYGGLPARGGPDKPRSDAQRLRLIEDKVDRLIDLLETLIGQPDGARDKP